MKSALAVTLSITLLLICGCSLFETRPSSPPPDATHKTLAVPIGKNWQLIEEAPVLTDGRLPFQTEQSVQPEGSRPVSPAERLNVETPR